MPTQKPELILTECQANGVKDLQAMLINPDIKIHVIEGYSGTGKSTMVKYFLDSMNSIIQSLRLINPLYPDIELHATATTQAACESLQTIIKREVSTIHSKIGLKIEHDFKNNTKTLIDTHRVGFKVDTTKLYLFLIDEASYITPRVWDMIMNKIQNLGINFKIILIGDPYQLIDIKAKNAYLFFRGFPVSQLEKVMRNDSQITEVSMMLRNAVKTNEFVPFVPDGKNVFHYDRAQFDKEMLADFNTPDWNHLQSKYLAYKNENTKAQARMIAQSIKGTKSIEAGDYLINNEYFKGKQHSLGNNKIVCIDAIAPGNHHGLDGNWVEVLGNTLFICDDLKAKEAVLKHYVRQGNEGGIRDISTSIIDLRFLYAQTVHKAQGLSLDSVYIDLDNLSECYNRNYMYRLLYVATSRARKKVAYTGDIA